jgi:hypothetical protein
MERLVLALYRGRVVNMTKEDVVSTTSNVRTEQSGMTGWVIFAGVLMVIGGALWAIQGFIAIFQNDVVIFGEEGALFLNVTGWGWVHLILGLLLLLSGILVMRGNLFGRTMAVILASLSIIVNFIWLPVYPVWAIVVIAIDVFILYAVIVYGKEMKSA